MTHDRRSFLTAVATAALGNRTLARQPRPKEVLDMLPVIDTHQHLWDLTKFKLSWLDPVADSGKILAQSYTPTEYAAATAGANVVKSVYMEVDVIPAQQQAEADYLTELCSAGKTTTVAAVVSGRPGADGFAKYAGQFKGSKFIKGLRQVLHVDSTPAGYALAPQFVAGLKLLGDLGLSFDLCVRPAELPDFAKLIDLCPNTRFILDHCGNADLKHTAKQREQWKTDMAEIARRKNLVCKVSGFIASAPARGKWTIDDLVPVVNHTLESFGPDRVMFGGDWPVCLNGVEKYTDWLTALRTIVADRPMEHQRKLFHDNAAKFYGLV